MLKSCAEEWSFLKKLSTFKGPNVRKLIGAGGGGEVQKKYSRKGKLNEKKIMKAN